MLRKMLPLLLVLIAQPMLAQPELSSLDAVPCDYEIYSSLQDMLPLQQVLVRRIEINAEEDQALAYSSWRLEFSSRKELQISYFKPSFELGIGFGEKLSLEFYDTNGQLLNSQQVPSTRLRRVPQQQTAPEHYYYSVDLLNIPMLVLASAKRINLTLMRPED